MTSTETTPVGGRALLLDLSAINLDARVVDRAGIERSNPHRGAMALLDAIIWYSADYTRGVAIHTVREDEFWVPGHFPGAPMMPGVIQLEIGAQLASFLYNARFPEPKIAAFIKVEEATFRNKVAPGDTLYVLSLEKKFTPRRFSSQIQGVVNGKIAFDALICGMALENDGTSVRR